MKKTLALLLSLAMIAALAGCGSSSAPAETTAAPAETEAVAETEAPAAETEAPAAETEAPAEEAVETEAAETEAAETEAAAVEIDGDPVTIKFSLSHAATEPACVAAYEFADAVAAKSGGNMTVEVYPDNQLGSERDVVEGLQLHTVQMVDPANAVLSNFVPEVGIFSLPMLFESKEQLYNALDTVGMTFVDKCAEQGLQLLGWFDMGTRHIMTVNKPIESMEDLNGLKIRTQESTVELAGMASFGAASMPMAYNELYTALESGVLDGAEAANTNYLAKAFYEVAPNWAIVGWLEVVCPVLMDKEFYDGLTDSQKAVLEECVADMLVSEREKYAQSEEDALVELEAKGVNITHPDRAPFQEKAIEIYKQYEGEFGKENIEGLLGHSYE